jgi:serpin B
MNSDSYKQISLIVSDQISKSNYINTISSLCKTSPLNGHVNEINEFVSQFTNGMIRSVLDAEGIANLYLINVIYFKSNWIHKFDRLETIDKQFNGIDGSRIVKMMCQTEKFMYSNDHSYQLLEMSYSDHLYSMGLILPYDRNNFQIQNHDMNNLIRNLTSTKVILEVPKFQMTVSTNLNNAISSLGLSKIFRTINIPNILNPEIKDEYVQEVRQKIVIKVDEEGTELAIATTMNCLEYNFEGKAELIRFICDRPFMFYIRNMRTNIIVCMGRYA